MLALLTAIPCLTSPQAYSKDTVPPLTVQSAVPFPALTEKFKQSEGWTGADAAWSFQVSPDCTVWTFGDTWIGTVKDGKHVDAHMINNTVGIQRLNKIANSPLAPIKYYWRQSSTKPQSIFLPDQKGKWFWPGAGLADNGSLYFVLHRIRSIPAKEPDFGFAEDGNLLCRVRKPQELPPKWNFDTVPLPDFAKTVQFGNACLGDDKYLYCYCSYREAGNGAHTSPIILARISKEKMRKLSVVEWQFFQRDMSGSNNWRADPAKSTIMFADAASEMSVSQVPGIKGFVATYIAGFGPEILLRHANFPWGPWSDPIVAYRCPEDSKKQFVYSAKAHPELAQTHGELIVTYCSNTKFFADQVNQADLYSPQAVRVLLTKP